MRILLSYSRRHFDPALAPTEQPFWGTSANIIARTLHGLLSEMGDVTYIDPSEVDGVPGGSYDLVVGIARDFAEVAAASGAPQRILIAVNVHPAERNRRLLEFVEREGLPTACIASDGLVDVAATEAAIAVSTHILCFGNVSTFNTYVRAGVPASKLRVLNYATTPTTSPEAGVRADGPVRFVHVASEVGLRKGFDVVADTFGAPELESLDFELHIVGAPQRGRYERQVAAFVAAGGGRVFHHGWLEASSLHYAAILDRADFLFLPSLEEGQAGTALDAIARGAVPIVSAETGIDFAPLGFCQGAIGAAANVDLVKRACALSEAELHRMREQTLAYHEELHAGWAEPLADALRDAVTGPGWPRMSVIVPLFNKERTARRLLDLLDRAMSQYPDCELHIVLDGCTDSTPERVEQFLATPRSYPVRVDETPDIFEIKTNNIGLRAATGRYGVIVQDDNFIYDETFMFEAATFLEKDRTAAVLGGLAGVNFYPRGTAGLEGPGQIAMTEDEVYWRQDANTDPELVDHVFEVDACMRGPLVLRKSFLEQHGYLDEAYAPLYQDDMDLCLRARDRGHKVYCMLMDVDNDSGTMGTYDPERWERMVAIMKRNSDLLYSRWTPSTDKSGYLRLRRVRISDASGALDRGVRLRHQARRRYIAARRSWLHIGHVTHRIAAMRQRLQEHRAS
jgi:glycosyltransferase involved in cell wall biosynthesis